MGRLAKERTPNIRQITEYLFPRWINLIASGWLTAPPEVRYQQFSEFIGPVIDLEFVPGPYIRKALRYVFLISYIYACDGNLSLVARKLNIHRSTLVRELRKMKAVGLEFSPTLAERLYARNDHA